MHHREKRLFERVVDGTRRGPQLREALLDQLGCLWRVVHRAADAYADVAQPSRRSRVGEEVVRQDAVQVEHRVPVEADLVGILGEELDGVLVIEDHLRLGLVTPLRLLAERDQALRVEQGVGVAFEAARVPGQIDQQPVQDGARVGACGLHRISRAPGHGRQTGALLGTQVEMLVGAVAFEELAVVAHWLPRGLRALDEFPDVHRVLRERNGSLGGARDTVSGPLARAIHHQPAFSHQASQLALQGATR